ncbi:MAG: hypothetical protein Cons2KO_27250 [Congregibacter sp.]
MRTVKRGYTDLPNGQAHWRQVRPPSSPASAGLTTGEKTPVACLHMMPKSSRSFQKLLPELAINRCAIAPDLPGYGASDALDDTPSVEGYAQWLWSFIDHTLGDETVVNLLGYHTGSMIAAEAAAQQPMRVERIVNVSAPVFSDAEARELEGFFQPIPLDDEGTRFRIMWERIMKFRGKGMTLEMAAASLSDNLLGGEDYEDGHRAAFAHSPRYAQLLGELPHRLLVMNIKDDLYAVTQRCEPLLKNGLLREYSDWENGFLESHPDAVGREVLSFFDGD